ncbi:MAG: MFS transporter [Bacteroidales bacterium]|nr:MFS transporter [Bacteroidales bacterium]
MIPKRDLQYYQFCAYGFLKNLRFFDPFLLLFFLSKGFSYFEIGQLYAVREIGFFITEIPSGILADAIGRKKSLVFSYLAYLLSFIAFYFASSFFLLAAAMLLFSFGESFRSGTHKALIFAYLEQNNWTSHKTAYYGNTRACSQLGSAFSAAIAAFIVIFDAHLENIFIYSTFPYVLGLINISLYPASLDKIQGQKSLALEFKNAIDLSLESFRYLKQKPLFKAVLNTAVYSAYYKASKDYLQVLILGFSATSFLIPSFNLDQRNAFFIGVSYTLLFLLSSIASKNSARFLKLFRKENSALNDSLLIGIGFGAIAGGFLFMQFKMAAILLFFVIYLIENLRKPIGISRVVEFSNQRINATVLSVSSQLQAIIAAVLALVLGFMSDQYSVGIALFVCSLLLISAAPLFWLKNKHA